MKILTYNIHYWEGTDGVIDAERIVEVVRASEADIVGLNEVYHPALVKGLDRPALEYMATQLDMHFIYGQAQTFGLAFDRPGHSYGNAILSRWPILASAAHHLTPTPGHAPRGLLEARILLPGEQRTITLYVTHLDSQNEDVRLTQAQDILTWTARDQHRPHVLMGDINSYSYEDHAGFASAEALQQRVEDLGWQMYEGKVLPLLLKRGYIDAWIQAGGGPAATYEAPDPNFRIDYIFVSKPLRPSLRACRRWDADPASAASDHFPVLLELDY